MGDIRKLNRGWLLASAASVAMFFSAAATAQDAAPAEPAAAAEAEAEEEDDKIVVTGSLLRRSEFESVSPITVITTEEAKLEGLFDTASIIQGSSITAGSVQFNNSFGGFITEGGRGVQPVSLRGLGANRTLVLLNSKRPGGAGTRGQVQAFDTNVLPSSIIQRIDILRDGASSIYGSDAVAGVVNIFTRDQIERPEMFFNISAPEAGGGEIYTIGGAIGYTLNDRHNFTLSGEWQVRNELDLADRDFLQCAEDLVYSDTGERVDRQDRSTLVGTGLEGCPGNIYQNTVIGAFTGRRFVPSPNGVTSGPIPGYRPRANQTYTGPEGQAFYEDWLNNEKFGSQDFFNRTEVKSAYATADFELDILGGIDWTNELLLNQRNTQRDGWRQFFPLIGSATSAALLGGNPVYVYANDPGYDPFPGNVDFALTQPVTIWPSNEEVTVDYLYFASQLDGAFGGFLDGWDWQAYGTYSRSDGDYENNVIVASRSGDVQFDDNSPVYDPYSAEFLSGNYSQGVYDSLSANTVGNTVYEQTTFAAVAAGELFSLPGGPIGAAIGLEFRENSINDVPDELSQSGDLWGQSSALITAGEESVVELFGELELPLIKGAPLIEEFNINLSGRTFEYDRAGGGDVYKAGFNWQVNPQFRFRGAQGTSFRAPALFELFLGDQTGFLSQLAIDPCINWGESTNENIQANCAADGIPDDYAGGGSSALVISGGNGDLLKPETAESTTIGFVFTPSLINLQMTVDYFDIIVEDQIGELDAGSILFSCYGADNFPNVFCDLFERNPSTDPVQPFGIDNVRETFVNINEQSTNGIDLSMLYEHSFDFGDVTFDLEGTWTLEDVVSTFDATVEDGFDTNDFNGTVGDPDFVANLRVSLERGDWTYNWFSDFTSRVSQADFSDSVITYFGRPNTNRKIHAEAVFYHDASVRWSGDQMALTFGVSNLFDEPPPTMAGVVTRRGNVPLFAGQYDIRGRTFFMELNKQF